VGMCMVEHGPYLKALISSPSDRLAATAAAALFASTAP
jgi:hypothetical protein